MSTLQKKNYVSHIDIRKWKKYSTRCRHP